MRRLQAEQRSGAECTAHPTSMAYRSAAFEMLRTTRKSNTTTIRKFHASVDTLASGGKLMDAEENRAKSHW